MDALSLLADSALFYGTPRERLEPLAAAAARRSYARGAYLFHEGDPGRHLFLILSGEVKIARVGHGGGEAVFTVLLPGDVFGELALFDDEGLRTSDAQAIVATECLTVDRGVLMDFLVRQPETMRRLIGLLGRHIRRKDDAFSEVSFLDISGRALEVNTSSPLASADLVRWFREEGGEAVSFGSDAHQPRLVGQRFDLAVDVVETAGFRPGRDRFDFWRR